MTQEEIMGLSKLGHQLKETPYRYGNMQAIQYNKNSKKIFAESDPRGEGQAIIR